MKIEQMFVNDLRNKIEYDKIKAEQMFCLFLFGII